ncbi:MAG: methylenetetrahydrofolate--tRNA-(uracil(54)-C(5))-methyltransferase (FADH(2)-oxidizing) TrmFO [Anaerolineae bacterium]|nr:methylenetetrahydrofolate--tRNA-(uracil(54)-C(5))-methyltransferase (FADH(2)-oxidizing) TrmFO [Anaerolineae bacterium]
MAIVEHDVIVIGAGLAGSEAAWQAAERGARVLLYEMRPARMTAAHESDRMAELVCSNSLGSNLPDRALGVLKNEMRRLGSLVIRCADEHAVPAGGALAVDRDAFSQAVTDAVTAHPNIEVRREEVTALPQGKIVVVATGPLTGPALAEEIQKLAGDETLYFFDAMAPIVTVESVDMSIAFRQSRYDKSAPRAAAAEATESGGDYINCPLTKDEYFAFMQAVNDAEKLSLRELEADDEARRYFEGCLPIEVLAARDPMALAFGPMRPVGLRDPRTGRRPYAAVQLRQDNAAGTLYNLVGFQTNIKWGDQERVLRMIPGLANAEFVRFGQMHRNTFLNSPRLLRPTLQWQGADRRDDLFFAGQITGTEGYVGSAAGGLVAGINAWAALTGRAPWRLPPSTMLGALLRYITEADAASFQPMKANFGLLPELDPPVREKRRRYAAYAERALADLETAIGERPDLGIRGGQSV